MPISVTCPQCQKNFRVADGFAGKQGRCPQCNFVLIVPNPDDRGPKNPFGGFDKPSVDPASPVRREPDRDRDDEPPPRRRPDREVDDRRRRDDRDRDRERERERDRYRDDEEDDVPPSRGGERSWQIVSFGRSLLTLESVLNLVGRGCLLLVILVGYTMIQSRSGEGLIPILLVLLVVGVFSQLIAYPMGLAGRMALARSPDRIARGEAGVCVVLGFAATGVMMIGLIVMILSIDDRPSRYGGPPVSLLGIIGVVAGSLYYGSELFVARFIARVGQLTRNRALVSWGPIITIYMIALAALLLINFIIGVTSRDMDVIMIFYIIFLAADYGGVVTCFMARLRLASPLRQLQSGGVPPSREDRFDEDEPEDDRRDRKSSRRSPRRDEEYD